MSALARKLAVNTSYYAAGRVAVSAAGVLATALATRYLAPERFGELTAAVVYVSLVALACDLGLYVVTARELSRRPDAVRALLANAVGLGLVLSVAATALGLGAMFLLYPGAGEAGVREAIAVLSPQLLFYGPGGAASAYLTYRQRAGPVALASVLGSAVLVGGVVLAISTDAGFGALAAAYLAQGLVTGLFPVLVVLPQARPLRPGLDLALWRRLAAMTAPQTAVLVLTTVYFRIDILLLSVWSTDRQVALYGVAYRVLEGLVVLPILFMLTLFPELARLKPGAPRLAELVQHAFSTMTVAAVPIALVVAAFSPEIVGVIGGADFAAAAPVLAVLMLAVAVNFLVAVLAQTLVALGEQRILARAFAVILLANLVANGLLIPPFGALGASAALVASELLALGLLRRGIARVGARPAVFRPGRLLLAGALAAAAGLGLSAAALDDLPAVVELAVGPPVVVVLFGLALLVLRGVPSSLDMLSAPLERRLGLRS